mmetsp:Transcript_56060/g.133025  ORF Transcript_56060/g.133025 Transcript_56060/m.133025 type:complete len:423 (+) Transcript_56060:664-1932(+)
MEHHVPRRQVYAGPALRESLRLPGWPLLLGLAHNNALLVPPVPSVRGAKLPILRSAVPPRQVPRYRRGPGVRGLVPAGERLRVELSLRVLGIWEEGGWAPGDVRQVQDQGADADAEQPAGRGRVPHHETARHPDVPETCSLWPREILELVGSAVPGGGGERRAIRKGRRVPRSLVLLRRQKRGQQILQRFRDQGRHALGVFPARVRWSAEGTQGCQVCSSGSSGQIPDLLRPARECHSGEEDAGVSQGRPVPLWEHRGGDCQLRDIQRLPPHLRLGRGHLQVGSWRPDKLRLLLSVGGHRYQEGPGEIRVHNIHGVWVHGIALHQRHPRTPRRRRRGQKLPIREIPVLAVQLDRLGVLPLPICVVGGLVPDPRADQQLRSRRRLPHPLQPRRRRQAVRDRRRSGVQVLAVQDGAPTRVRQAY